MHQDSQSNDASLGTLLDQSRPSFIESLQFAIVALILSGTVFVMALYGRVSSRAVEGGIPDAEKNWRYYAGAILALYLMACFLYIRRRVVRFHENGIESRTWLSHRIIRLGDLHELAYSATRAYAGGTYDSTRVSIKAKSSPERGAQTISHTIVKRERAKLFSLIRREFINALPLSAILARYAEQMAAAWRTELAAGRSIEWCGGFGIAPHGIVVGSSAREVPFTSVTGAVFNSGTLELTLREPGSKPLCISSKLPNFWVGYRVLLTMLRDIQVDESGIAFEVRRGIHIPIGA